MLAQLAHLVVSSVRKQHPLLIPRDPLSQNTKLAVGGAPHAIHSRIAEAYALSLRASLLASAMTCASMLPNSANRPTTVCASLRAQSCCACALMHSICSLKHSALHASSAALHCFIRRRRCSACSSPFCQHWRSGLRQHVCFCASSCVSLRTFVLANLPEACVCGRTPRSALPRSPRVF